MFAINREMQALDPWENCKFSLRKMFGCFAPGSHDGNKCKNCLCAMCCSETLDEFEMKLKERDLYKELMLESP